jgi:uncharacterized membrane protein
MRVSRVIRTIRARPRLSGAALLGLVSLLFLPRSLPETTRALLAWDIGVGTYLVLAWTMMLRSDIERMRWRSSRQDDGAVAILLLTVLAAIASVAAIVLELLDVSDLPTHEVTLRLALVVLTIVFSWSFIHTAFALHYAHEYYDDEHAARPCLRFPGTEQPDYADFLYFAFVIGTTSQTADVEIASRTMRRLALLHGVISFFFNTTLLAVTVNITAGLV